jgi:1-acyl-sn-glycerol-3-phosphate acyltransferase
MMRSIISLPIYLFALSVFIVVGILFIISSFILPIQLRYKSSRALCWAVFTSLGIRIKIIGSPPPPGHHIYMCNHSSFVDMFLFAYLMRGPCTALIAKENYSYPILGSMLKRFKGISIERGDRESAIKSIHQAEQMLSIGYDVVILPEGTRTTTGNLRRFKKGGFHMALNTKAPIVPVGCTGAFEFKPKNRWSLSPRTITLKYGTPTDPSTYDSLGDDGLRQQLEQKIKELTNRKFEDEV